MSSSRAIPGRRREDRPGLHRVFRLVLPQRDKKLSSGWPVTRVRALTGLTAAARLVVRDDLIPSVPGPMRRALLRKLPVTTREGAAAVYFPACINRIFGRDPGQARTPSLPQVLIEVSARAGQPLWIPGDVAGKCCSTW